jgi:hypothetical protein
VEEGIRKWRKGLVFGGDQIGEYSCRSGTKNGGGDLKCEPENEETSIRRPPGSVGEARFQNPHFLFHSYSCIPLFDLLQKPTLSSTF